MTNYIILAVVVAAIYFAARAVLRSKGGCVGCSSNGGCSGGCCGSASCNSRK